MQKHENAIIGIYKITSPNRKVYIGQSININGRKKQYFSLDCKKQPKLYNSLKKYGFENHIFKIIEECSLEQLNKREAYYKQQFIDEFGWDKALFCEIDDNSPRKGKSLSEETKDKISKANKGKIYSEESRQKISNSKKGKKHSEKHNLNKRKPRVNKGNLGKNKPKDFGEKVSKRLLGKKQSKETCLKKSLNMKGKVTKPSIPILQYDLEGNFIKRWSSLKEIQSLYKGDIQACCINKQNTAGGYKWKYEI
jgi:group I intron endonuclease